MTARRRLLASGLTLALGAGLLVASAGTAAAATITVNSLADTTGGDGSCTLREAIDNANDATPPAPWPDCATGSGNDTITFSVTGSILIGVALSVSDPAGLTIQGPGANLLELNGGGSDRVFIASAPLSLDALTVTGGDFGVNGGGILNNSTTLTITNSAISGNHAGAAGGGIYNVSGTLTITNSTFSDNHAVQNGGGIGNVSGTLEITNSTISGNEAGQDGGGIYNTNGPLTITNSTISGNEAGFGGGGISNSFSTLTITDSTLSDNSAGSEAGGGIYNSRSTLTITNSTLSDNSAGSDGGGIYHSQGFLSLTDSTLSGNTAANGGGIFNAGDSNIPDGAVIAAEVAQDGAHIAGTTFEGNQAYCNGGGIDNAAYLEITNSTFVANMANVYGGGLYNGNLSQILPNPESLSASHPGAEITNATFSGNSALGEASGMSVGGPVVFACSITWGPHPGGAIYNAVGAGPYGVAGLPTNPVILKGTIIDHSLEGGDCSGPITDGGYNLDSDDSCQLSDENSSLPSTDPDLEPLEDNGGPTDTMALNTGSPALDLIPPGVCEHFLGHSPEDQRGVVRPQGPGCDSGAFELEEGGTTPPPPPEQRWTEQTTIDLRGPFGVASASLGAERSSFKLKGTLYARHWFCQHNSQINLILVGQGQIGSTFTNGAGDFAFLTSLPQGEDQASYKARFPQKKGQPGRCKGSVSDPLVVTGG